MVLRKDPVLASCARDVIVKPLLSSGSSVDLIHEEVAEWEDLVVHTYLRMKEDQTLRHSYTRKSTDLAPRSTEGLSLEESKDEGRQSIEHFFGELEIRGLVALSYYALASHDGPAHLKVE